MASLCMRAESLLLTLAARIKSALLPLNPVSSSPRGVPLFFEDTNFMVADGGEWMRRATSQRLSDQFR